MALFNWFKKKQEEKEEVVLKTNPQDSFKQQIMEEESAHHTTDSIPRYNSYSAKVDIPYSSLKQVEKLFHHISKRMTLEKNPLYSLSEAEFIANHIQHRIYEYQMPIEVKVRYLVDNNSDIIGIDASIDEEAWYEVGQIAMVDVDSFRNAIEANAMFNMEFFGGKYKQLSEEKKLVQEVGYELYVCWDEYNMDYITYHQGQKKSF